MRECQDRASEGQRHVSEGQSHVNGGQGHSNESRSQVSEEIPVFIINVDTCSSWRFFIGLNFFFKYCIQYFILITEFFGNHLNVGPEQVPPLLTLVLALCCIRKECAPLFES